MICLHFNIEFSLQNNKLLNSRWKINCSFGIIISFYQIIDEIIELKMYLINNQSNGKLKH